MIHPLLPVKKISFSLLMKKCVDTFKKSTPSILEKILREKDNI